MESIIKTISAAKLIQTMTMSVTPSEISSNSSCDVNSVPKPPIRRKRIRSMLVMEKNKKQKQRKMQQINKINLFE